MNNEAAPSYFNGGSLNQYIDYRYSGKYYTGNILVCFNDKPYMCITALPNTVYTTILEDMFCY